jgi:hypothetical protein
MHVFVFACERLREFPETMRAADAESVEADSAPSLPAGTGEARAVIIHGASGAR